MSATEDEFYARGYGLRRMVVDCLNGGTKDDLRNRFDDWEGASGTRFLVAPTTRQWARERDASLAGRARPSAIAPEHLPLIETYHQIRDAARAYVPRQTEVTHELRRTLDQAPELRRRLREVGLHGYELAVQMLFLMASEQIGDLRDTLAETADKLVDLDRRRLEAAAS